MKKALKEILVVIIAVATIFTTSKLYIGLLNSVIDSKLLASEISGILSYLTPLAIVYIAHKTITPITLDISKKCNIETSVYEALGLLLIGGISSFLIIILGRFINNDTITAGNNMVNYSGSTALEIVFMLISVAIVAPIVEEILFRGILLGALRHILDIKPAIMFSSLAFGLLHRTSIMMIIAATISGIILSCIYLHHKNLINSIIVHAIFNFIATLSAIRPRLPVELFEVIETANVQFMILFGLGLVIYFIFIAKFVINRLKEKYNEPEDKNLAGNVPLWQRLLCIEIVED